MRRLLTLGALAVGAFAAGAVAQGPPVATAQPQPTIIITPASGPCDAAVEVKGRGFVLPQLPIEEPGPALYLVRPDTTDLSMGILNSVHVGRDGTFSQWAPLREHGCQAATLDSQSERRSGHLLIALSTGGAIVQAGERVPNIIAVAEYEYTTTVPARPPTMVISPASGPCDGRVEVRGRGFQPGGDIRLDMARADAHNTLGALASVVANSDGEFVVHFSLGETGCRAAQIHMAVGDRTPPQLAVVAYPIPLPQQIGASLAVVAYTFTTTEVGGGVPARALPPTGSGPDEASMPLGRLPLIGVLAALGLILVVAPLYCKRLRS